MPPDSAAPAFTPLTIPEVAALLHGLAAPWWVAGGLALDLYLGRTTREHGDLDIQVRRADQLLVQEHLRGWDLHKTRQPGLAPWGRGEVLAAPVNQVWARREPAAPWTLELMLLDTEGDEWVYRRRRDIRGPLSGFGLCTPEGVPYVRPEIQLLFKARPPCQPKDWQDLQATLPALSAPATQWLRECLQSLYPQGHDWLARLAP